MKALLTITAATATAWAIRRRAKRRAARRRVKHLHFETLMPPGVNYVRNSTGRPEYTFHGLRWDGMKRTIHGGDA